MSLTKTRDLAKKTQAAVNLLQQMGCSHTTVIAVRSSSPAVVYILARAAAALGLPLLPLDPALPVEPSKRLLQQAGSFLLVADEPFGDVPTTLTTDVLACPVADEIPPARLVADDLALLMASSGSSGEPRLIMLTAANLQAAAEASMHCVPLRTADCWLACLPLFHIGGFSIPVRCDLAGAEALLLPGFDVESVWQALHDEQVTHLSLVPTMLAKLLEHSTASPPCSLRHVLVSGAALSADLAARAIASGWPLQPSYGLTEAASQAATLPFFPANWLPGQVGPPLPGMEVALNEDGRLQIRGPMVMLGYANQARRPGDGLKDGWFVTQDLATLASDGSVRIIGRADAVIISGGKKVQPAKVEEQLLYCPGVSDVVVYGRPDAVWGELVVAAYCGTWAEDELMAWCRDHIPGALRPRVLRRLPELPLLANGKVDRRAMRAGNSG